MVGHVEGPLLVIAGPGAGGVLFFAKNMRHFFTEAHIICPLGHGMNKVHILDRKDFNGGIVADIRTPCASLSTTPAWRIALRA